MRTLACLFLLLAPAGLIIAGAESSARAKKTAPRKSGAQKSNKGKKTQSWRTRQLQPTPERYREIQQALAAKGYFKGEVAGVWNQESIDALRRFQEDQSLEPTGKIDSLSLIALGLGPKYDKNAATPPARP